MASAELRGIASALSEIERKALKALAPEGAVSVGELSKSAGLNIDSARRAVEWLAEKGLVDVSESVGRTLVLGHAGKGAFERGLPEIMLVRELQNSRGRAKLGDAGKAAGLGGEELNAALGIARKRGWIGIHKEKEGEVGLELTGLEKEALAGKYPPGELLRKIGSARGDGVDLAALGSSEKETLKELERRNLVEAREHAHRSIAISKRGQEALALLPKLSGERAYDVQGAVPEIFIGKKQPYMAFLSSVRKKLLELGFQEMETKLVELEFYNFDVLFQPQNHPARGWSDTYALKRPAKGKIVERQALKKVKTAHENGGRTGSRGWRYRWDEGVAASLMPCAHGTAASARQLVKDVEVPGKYFAIARCFRPDLPDATHLCEFNQMEGFVVDPSFNFSHLLGMLKQFAVEIAGAEEVKFYPDYYPFTEPSVQLSAKHPKLGWMEFGGAGIFRPEITEQLGIKGKCLAWGLGIDRLAMFKLGINDMRELFSQNLDWLRKEKLVV